jgi:hypothetical protein
MLKRTTIGTARLRPIIPGQTRAVAIRLSRTARAALQRGDALRVVLRVVLKPSMGVAISASRSLQIRLRRR